MIPIAYVALALGLVVQAGTEHCITALDRASGRLARVTGSNFLRCVKDAGQTFEQCLTRDEASVTAAGARSCTEPPELGPTTAADVNDASVALCLLHRAPASAEGFGIFSPAFRHGEAIPKKSTCDRADVSPPLGWIGAPAGTKSFVVIAEDPDVPAGSWVQWVLYDLPAHTRGVRQDIPPSERLPNGAKQGVNEFGRVGYTGPCPPPGKVHHYYFRVYALDAPTHLKPRATKARVYRAMRRHILRVSEVMGTYERRTRGHEASEAAARPAR